MPGTESSPRGAPSSTGVLAYRRIALKHVQRGLYFVDQEKGLALVVSRAGNPVGKAARIRSGRCCAEVGPGRSRLPPELNGRRRTGRRSVRASPPLQEDRPWAAQQSTANGCHAATWRVC